MLMFVATFIIQLERDIVVRWRTAAWHVLRFIVGVSTPTTATTASAATATAATSAVLRTEHLQLVGGNFQFGMLLAVLFPTIELQPAFDQYRRALAQILIGDFSRPAPQRDVDERDFVHPLIALLHSVVHG